MPILELTSLLSSLTLAQAAPVEPEPPAASRLEFEGGVDVDYGHNDGRGDAGARARSDAAGGRRHGLLLERTHAMTFEYAAGALLVALLAAYLIYALLRPEHF